MANFDDLLSNTPEQYDPPQLSKEEYAEKKKTEREELFALSDATAMEVSGNDEMFRVFLDAQAQLDRYSAVNALLAFAQNPDASRLGDFDYWKRQGCSIRPGETAISILEPHTYTKDDNTPGTGYNVKKVFDISQVDARKLRQRPAPQYTERQLLGALVTKAPVKIVGVDTMPEYIPDELGATYDQVDKQILVRKGMEFPDTFRAVAQELAFEDFNTGPDTQAEPHFSSCCAAYLVCKKYGVDTQAFNFENAPGVFEGMDAQQIKGELSQIRDAAENISGRMARQLEAQQKAAKSNDAR